MGAAESYKTVYSPLVTICTASLTFTNFTFCPRSVCICFVWISEQTPVTSLYSINWLIFITETECLLRGTDCTFTFRLILFLSEGGAGEAREPSNKVMLFLPHPHIPAKWKCHLSLAYPILLLHLTSPSL